jgi:hypothetical protein
MGQGRVEETLVDETQQWQRLSPPMKQGLMATLPIPKLALLYFLLS